MKLGFPQLHFGLLQNSGTMNEAPLDTYFDILDEERKLYAADSLNNLNKLNVCSDPHDLLSTELLDSSSDADKRELNDNKECPKAGPLTQLSRLMKKDEQPKLQQTGTNKTQCNSSRCLCILLIVLAVALVASLLLSFYAIYLMVQTAEKMNELSSSAFEEEYLQEIAAFKDIILKYLNQSTTAVKGAAAVEEIALTHNVTA
ncbi:hypothetical protein HHUSO_G15477 [Huso huso]|uniref:Uncharacterized protein n=1 Tax=Huso huso TaxID=61971 RepID=A0ABR0ZCC8_HUSHU